jgi:hypothetical protein
MSARRYAAPPDSPPRKPRYGSGGERPAGNQPDAEQGHQQRSPGAGSPWAQSSPDAARAGHDEHTGKNERSRREREDRHTQERVATPDGPVNAHDDSLLQAGRDMVNVWPLGWARLSPGRPAHCRSARRGEWGSGEPRVTL